MSERDFYCFECHNTGVLDCHCGGDLCVCMNNGSYPCPYCDGGMAGDDYDDEFDDYADTSTERGS
jgi:hypothetical protein